MTSFCPFSRYSGKYLNLILKKVGSRSLNFTYISLSFFFFTLPSSLPSRIVCNFDFFSLFSRLSLFMTSVKSSDCFLPTRNRYSFLNSKLVLLFTIERLRLCALPLTPFEELFLKVSIDLDFFLSLIFNTSGTYRSS